MTPGFVARTETKALPGYVPTTKPTFGCTAVTATPTVPCATGVACRKRVTAKTNLAAGGGTEQLAEQVIAYLEIALSMAAFPDDLVC